jgi:putative flippase GtrA
MANGVGWLVAFGVSFTGHHRWTFRHQAAPLARAAPKFFLVSAGGFLLNQLAYAAALRWSGVRYDIALAAVLVLVAGLTYLISRFWAFASPGDGVEANGVSHSPEP